MNTHPNPAEPWMDGDNCYGRSGDEYGMFSEDTIHLVPQSMTMAGSSQDAGMASLTFPAYQAEGETNEAGDKSAVTPLRSVYYSISFHSAWK